ncbi:MAG: sodium:proton antiporter [Xanthomonadales bacterium]|nr:sodium:proton antiporter [Gammaproteobacteria bacterium]MBT8055611.1 sodium:proton antiporter [Gammaproteobacteria bacterium]NNJ80501.1 sodium:proton antiporter [Xanthomonadales bacterium]NNL05427.1 sodium:proton antiporter [Xanthomonadales bacterium]
MFGNLLPFLMFGILLAAIVTRPLQRVRWLSLPVVLVVAGFVASEAWVALGMDTGLRWNILRDLVFYLLLPILIFEAAINIDARSLRREGFLIGTMAVPLLLIATGIAAALFMTLMGDALGGSWALALLTGAMICATDPTMVSGLLGGDGQSRRIEQILEGESLVNDATTITLFVMISGLLLSPTSEITALGVAGRFLLTLLGGAAIGVALGWLFDKLIDPANDKVLATSATLVLAFSSFWIGEHLLGFSGVVATLSAGLTVAWRQRTHRSETDIAFALDSWRILGFCASAMLFFAVGMSITLQMFADHWLAMMIGIGAALVSRAAIVFLGVGPLSLLPRVDRIGLSGQNLLMWGGIRGAVAIALALSLSFDIPHWYTIQSTVYGVALFSLVVQTPLLPILSRNPS